MSSFLIYDCNWQQFTGLLYAGKWHGAPNHDSCIMIGYGLHARLSSQNNLKTDHVFVCVETCFICRYLYMRAQAFGVVGGMYRTYSEALERLLTLFQRVCVCVCVCV